MNAKRIFLDEMPIYWVPALNKVPVPKVFVLDDLSELLGIISDRLLLSF